MSIDVGRVQKSGRRVKKFLRKNSKKPSPSAIHQMRTGSRRLETTFAGVGFDASGKVRRLLRELRDVRKSAGKVRDMDVLTADALMLAPKGEDDCLVQLLEHLGAERNRYARKLHIAIQRTDPKLKHHLKQNLKRLEKTLKKADSDKSTGSSVVPTAMAKAIKISAELARPAHLNRNNLHPYRLKVKDLRDVLQLGDRSEGSSEQFIETLGKVKDAIGDWHDWEELNTIASQLLDHGTSCKLIKRLRANRDSKLKRALSVTSHFRKRYLQSNRSARGPDRRNSASASEPVLEATAAIA